MSVGSRGAIWLDNTNCVGNESSILDCDHRVLGVSDCNHDEDVVLACNQGTANIFVIFKPQYRVLRKVIDIILTYTESLIML